MEFSAAKIAQIIEGRIEGNPDILINNLSKIQDATPNCVAFLSNPLYENYIYNTNAGVVLVDASFIPKEKITTTLIWVENAYSAFSKLLEYYSKLTLMEKVGVEQPSYIGTNTTVAENSYRGAFSYIGNNTKIGSNAKIYPNSYVGDNVVIGDNCIIYAGVKIYSDTRIGNNCTFQSGCVIGSDGFGFAPQSDGTFKTIPQVGNVIIADWVDVGANTVIDRATMGSTIIKSGVKLDNLIQIAHNVEVGKNTVMAAQTGIAGSTKIGENCIFAGQSGIVGHINIANKTVLAAKAGLSKSIKEEGKTFAGYPGIEHKAYLKTHIIYKKLPALLQRIIELETKISHISEVKSTIA